MVRALSAGKLSSYREGAQISGVQTSLLVEDEGPKQDLSQRLFCFGLSQKLLASVVHTLTCADYFCWSQVIEFLTTSRIVSSMCFLMFHTPR